MTASVLVTRPQEQASALCAALRARGIEAVSVPTVAIDRSSSAPDLDRMLDALDGNEWLVITSANGAAALGERIAAGAPGLPATTRVAAVGPMTAAALADAGIRVDHVPGRYLTAAVADGLGDLAGRRVVLARADAATPELRDLLIEAGAEVTEVVAYRTIEGPTEGRRALHAALQRDLAGIAFASASAVRGLRRLASATDLDRARAIPALCIGPVTAGAARRLGFGVEIVADESTAEGLADAIARHLGQGVR